MYYDEDPYLTAAKRSLSDGCHLLSENVLKCKMTKFTRPKIQLVLGFVQLQHREPLRYF